MATSSSQKQGGQDSAVSITPKKTTKSTRVQPEQVTVVTQESAPKTSTTVTAASTQRSVQVEKVGFTLSFTIKINNSLPPKLLS
jgi:hypothetical protein